MRPFRYALDPVCWISCTLYAVNRWALPASWKTPFLRNHFDDVLLIPAALPLMLWLERQLGWRKSDDPPDLGEVGFHLAVWAIATELVGPRLFARATGDFRDVLAYTAGAALAAAVWRFA